MLRIEGLRKRFGRVRAVDGLTFEVRPGEIVGLLGPNGAGKTTTLRCVVGILRPDEGRVFVNGIDATKDEVRAKSLIGYVPEVPGLYDLLTPEEHLRLVAASYGLEPGWERFAEELLEAFDLATERRRMVGTFSRGMKQKLAIVCALLHRPKVYLLDEPLVGVDPKGTHEVKRRLDEEKRRGCAILVSTHMLDTAERLCDRIVVIHRGKNVAEGTLDELRAKVHAKEDATLEEVFLKLVEEAEEERAS